MTDTYTGGAKADVACAQAQTRYQANAAGVVNAYSANTLRQNDLGTWIDGLPVVHYSKWPTQPSAANWTLVGGASTTLTPTPSLATPTYATPALYVAASSGSAWAEVPMASVPAPGATVIVQGAFKFQQGGTGAVLEVTWDGGGREGWELRDLQSLNTNPPAINNVTFNETGVNTILRAVGLDANGCAFVAFSCVVPSTGFKVRVRYIGPDGPNHYMGVMSVDCISGQSIRAFNPGVAGSGLTEVADVVGPVAATNIEDCLKGTSGYVKLVVQKFQRNLLGEIAGALLKFGATVAISATDSCKVTAGSSTARSKDGGFRGISIIGLTWDGTEYVLTYDGSAVSRTTGTISRTGAVTFLFGVSGQLLEVAFGPTKLSDSALRALCNLDTYTCPRPGSAFTPARWGVLTEQRFFDGTFDPLLHRSPSATFPAADGTALAEMYKASYVSDNRRFIKPRFFFDTANSAGSDGQSRINNQPEANLDYDKTGSFATLVYTGGELIGKTQLTANLTGPQQALVPAGFNVVSFRASTWGNADQGGVNINKGVSSACVKMPHFPGMWPAVWWYYFGSPEDDGYEGYGPRYTQFTGSLHSGNFSYNLTSIVEMGFDPNNGYHNYTVLRRTGFSDKFLDGELLFSQALSPSLETSPFFFLINLAVYPDFYNSGVANPIITAQDDRSKMRFAQIRLSTLALT